MALNFPQNPVTGQTYTVGNETWIWTGTAWTVAPAAASYAPVSIGPNPPTQGILAGDLWWNNTTGRLFIYYKDTDSSQWVAANQVPDPIVEVSTTQVVDAFLDSLTAYVNNAAAVAAGVPNGALYKLTGQTGVGAIRSQFASSTSDAIFANLNVTNSFTLGGTLLTVTGEELNYVDGVTSSIQTQLNSMVTLSGMPAGSLTLGTFTGSVIPDASTIKQAIQALETAIDDGQADEETNALIALSGVAALSTNLGVFSGSIISDNTTIKTALQQLETNLGTNNTNTAALNTLSGVAVGAVSLGTFSGSIITDSASIKVALQELETATQAKAQTTTADALVTLTGVPIDSTNLGAFTGSIINDTSQIKQAIQALETAVESSPHQVQGNPTEIQFNQAGQFAASSNLTFNTGTSEFLVNGVIRSNAVNGETVVLKASLSDVTYFSVSADGTLINNGEATFKQRVTFQRNSASSVVLRTSADNGTSFTPLLTADGSISTPGSVSFTALDDYADDTAAAAGGIAIGQLYRNGSVVMVRVS